MPYYALTLKKTRGKPTKKDYEGYLSTLLHNNPSVRNLGHYYELTRGLHVHALLSAPILGYSDCINVEGQRGWNINVSEVRSLEAWSRYIIKDQPKFSSDSRSSKSDPSSEGGSTKSDTDELISLEASGDKEHCRLMCKLRKTNILKT